MTENFEFIKKDLIGREKPIDPEQRKQAQEDILACVGHLEQNLAEIKAGIAAGSSEELIEDWQAKLDVLKEADMRIDALKGAVVKVHEQE